MHTASSTTCCLQSWKFQKHWTLDMAPCMSVRTGCGLKAVGTWSSPRHCNTDAEQAKDQLAKWLEHILFTKCICTPQARTVCSTWESTTVDVDMLTLMQANERVVRYKVTQLYPGVKRVQLL
jgi:hypothetical protein